MKKIEDKSIATAKKKLVIAVIFMIAGVIYTISPIDLIPDVLGPIGWVDDLVVMCAAFIYYFYSYKKLKRLREAGNPEIKD
jgi:uncharacterized membrane protein YkvA (DUF1232 family)